MDINPFQYVCIFCSQIRSPKVIQALLSVSKPKRTMTKNIVFVHLMIANQIANLPVRNMFNDYLDFMTDEIFSEQGGLSETFSKVHRANLELVTCNSFHGQEQAVVDKSAARMPPDIEEAKESFKMVLHDTTQLFEQSTIKDTYTWVSNMLIIWNRSTKSSDLCESLLVTLRNRK